MSVCCIAVSVCCMRPGRHAQHSVSVCCISLLFLDSVFIVFSIPLSLPIWCLCLSAVSLCLYSLSLFLSLCVSIRCLYFYRILHIAFVQPPPLPPPPPPTAPSLVQQALKNKAQERQVKRQVKRPVKHVIAVTKPGMAGAEEENRGALRGDGACAACML